MLKLPHSVYLNTNFLSVFKKNKTLTQTSIGVQMYVSCPLVAGVYSTLSTLMTPNTGVDIRDKLEKETSKPENPKILR